MPAATSGAVNGGREGDGIIKSGGKPRWWFWFWISFWIESHVAFISATWASNIATVEDSGCCIVGETEDAWAVRGGLSDLLGGDEVDDGVEVFIGWCDDSRKVGGEEIAGGVHGYDTFNTMMLSMQRCF